MPIKLPDSKEVVRAITMCAGTPVKTVVEEKPKAPSLMAPPKGCYASLCLDDAGEPAAALIVDLVAAVSLGGALVTLPAGVLKEQVKAGAANEMVLDGLSEVLNMLAGTLNRVSGNAHIRATPAKPLVAPKPGTEFAWLGTAAARTDYVCTFPIGQGRLSLVCK